MASAVSLQSLQQSLGLSLSREWLAAFAGQAGPAFASAGGQRQKQLLFEAFLVTDLRQAGAGCLPADLQVSAAARCNANRLAEADGLCSLQGWDRRTLAGRTVLQVDEVVNIAAAARSRYEEAGKGRCLKLLLTDGEWQLGSGCCASAPALTAPLPLRQADGVRRGDRAGTSAEGPHSSWAQGASLHLSDSRHTAWTQLTSAHAGSAA